MAKTVTANTPIDKVNGIKINTSLIQTKKCYKYTSREVKYVVMHYTGNASDTARGNASYVINGNSDVSAHYFVDDNNIYQSVPFVCGAWHCGDYEYFGGARNGNSIGIEMCTSGNYKMSAKTIENSAQLCASICKVIGIQASGVDAYVVRHYDVTHKRCPAPWVDDNSAWIAFKTRVKALLGGVTAKPTAKPTASSYKVKILDDDLNIRKGAGTGYQVVGQIKDHGVYTIVETKGTFGTAGSWGKLKSGAGWISLNKCFVKKV